jgi:EAL domain-containing protein (putative c-di-GMP-specific phosphodiesterase class I)
VLLRNISPDFAQLENRYLASVNLQLSRLEINDGNKELVDAFMAQLAKLDIEYKRLNLEITETGITDEMVTAMIENLELRVELMMKLKAKLKELKAEADHAAAVQTI